MNHDQIERISGIVDVLLGLPAARRDEALQTLCPSAEDVSVRAEVERLLVEDAGLEKQLASLHRTRVAETTLGPLSGVAFDLSRSEPPPVIGRYHLKKRIGGGGMGEVFLAEQRASIKQTVAIKLIKPGFDSKEVIARFNAERQALARMDHPNIARVLDAGVTDTARPYFVMEYVPGKPITQFADEQRLSIRQRLELFIEVCDAIAHAHTKGVIHRDLKPSNVLTLVQDGKPRVKVIDFGIAKALDGERLSDATYITGIGMVLGTFEYMSPEQAAGSPDVDTRSDVYSLGVLLYELLVGVRPFERTETSPSANDELRRVIREVEPPRPSTRVRSLTRAALHSATKPAAETAASADPMPSTHFDAIAAARMIEPRMLVRLLARELEWIPLKALRKESARRYAGPAEMAADVRNYLDGRPLWAAPESRSYRLRKFVVRHGVALAFGAAVLALLIAGVIGTSIGFVRESQSRRLADENGRRAMWSAYRSAIAAADAARRSGDGVRLNWALNAAPSSLRGWEWNMLARSDVVRISEFQRRPSDRVVATTLLPDGRQAWSTIANENTSGSVIGMCVLWDLTSGKEIRREQGNAVAVDPSRMSYTIARSDGSLECCDQNSGAVLWKAAAADGRPWNLTRNAYALDGSIIAAWDGVDSSLTLFDAKSGTSRRMPLTSVPTRVIGFLDLGRGTPGGDLVFYLSSMLSPLRMDVQTGVSSRQFGIDFVLDRLAVSGTTSNSVHAMAEPNKLYQSPSRGFNFYRTVLLPHRQCLAYGRDNGSVTVTAAIASGSTRAYDLIVGASPISDLSVTSDEQWFVVTLQDGSVHVIQVDEPPQVAIPFQGIQQMSVSSDGTKVASTGWGDVLCLDAASGMPLFGRNLGPYDNTFVAWSKDGKLLAVAAPIPRSADGVSLCDVFVLDGESGSQIAAWSASAVEQDPHRPAAPPAWSRDMCGLAFTSSDLCIAHVDGSITRIDLATWQPRSAKHANVATTQAMTAYRGLVSSTDGSRWLQTTSIHKDNQPAAGFVIRDTATSTILSSYSIDGYEPSTAAWSHDGRFVVAGFFRRGEAVIVCVDSTTGVERFKFSSTSEDIRALTFTRDDDRVIAFARPPAMIVLDAGSGEEILTATRTTGTVAAEFAPNGSLLSAGGESALNSIDGPNVDATLADIQQRWPAQSSKPQTVSDARKQVRDAMDVLMDAYNVGNNLEQGAKFSDADPSVRSLARAFALRRPPNVNLLNSGALSMMLISDPLPQELARGVQMLEIATSIKPHSGSLQRNYGTIMFQSGQFEEAIGPLKESVRLAAERGSKPAPAILLRIAIAMKHASRQEATAAYELALREVQQQQLASDPEIVPLLDQARQEFGH